MIGRTTSLFLICWVATGFAQVQNPEFGSVAKKFEKGKFESALESADALIDNDKHRKKPEPYLWASMCYYAIHESVDEKLKDRFKNALRDALKYAGKAYIKDKKGDFVKENVAHFQTMKEEGVRLAKSYEAAKNYRKAAYTYKQLLVFVPDDPYIRFAKGITDLRQNAAYDAEREINKSLPLLETNYRNLEYEPDPVSSPLLKESMLFYIDHLIENAYLDSAKQALRMSRIFFPMDEELKETLKVLD